ncbi:MAG: hypothetical protein HY829_06225 [Actinobacteria bacterium]|nr:hypothetical protein [Actinomycetota bacterium]
MAGAADASVLVVTEGSAGFAVADGAADVRELAGVADREWVCAEGEAVRDDEEAVAASSLADTCGGVRTFVDEAALKTAAARHTTRLVRTVARIHDAATAAEIRRPLHFLTPPW